MAIDRNKVIAAAQKYIQKGAYRKAIKEYKKIVKEHPDDVRILLKIGDLEARDGQATAAARTYNEVADHYVAHGFFLKAVAAYKLLLGVQPENVEAKLRLADLYFQLGLLRDALANYQQVAAVFNERAWVEQYLQTLQRIVEIDPDNPGNRIKLGEELQRFEDADAATDHFLIAAGQLKKQGRFEEYTKTMERYVQLAPHDIQHIHDLARIYLQQERPKRALVHIQPLLKSDPKNPETLDILVRSLGKLGHQSRAVSVLEELAQAFEEDAAYVARDEIYKQLLELQPDHAGARAALGVTGPAVAPSAQSQQAAAPAPEPAAEQAPEPERKKPIAALVADPGTVTRLIDETDVYLKYNLYEKALGHLENVFAVDPDNLGALERRKTALAATGMQDDAVDVLIHMARVVNPTDPLKAARYLNEALALRPEHAGLKAATAELGGGTGNSSGGGSDSGNSGMGGAAGPGGGAPPVASGGAQGASSAPESGAAFEHLDALFGDEAPVQAEAGADHSISGGPFVVEEESDVAVVALESQDILPADLDDGLEKVEAMVVAGDIDDARGALFELLGAWPEHAELLLRRMDELPDATPEPVVEPEQPEEAAVFFVEDDADGSPSAPGGTAPPAMDAAADDDDEDIEIGGVDDDIDMTEFESVDEAELSGLGASSPGTSSPGTSSPGASAPGAAVSPISSSGASAPATVGGVDAPIGRASSSVDSTFGPADTVLRDDPSSTLADAIRLRRQGNGMAAIMTLQQGGSGPAAVAAAFELALANIEMGLYFEGISSLEDLLGVDGLREDDRLLVHYYLGIAYEAMDQAKLAAQNFRAVSEKTPDLFPDVFIRLERISA